MHRHLTDRRTTLLLVAGLTAACISVGAYALHVLRGPELQSVDVRFTVRGDQPPPDGIVVVAIDDLTFSELRERFPFPRRLHAQLIDRLRSAGVRTIGFDVQFTEPTSRRDDNALIRAMARAPGVVLAATETGHGGSTNVLGGEQGQRLARVRVGSASLPPDQDGVFRRTPCRVDGLKTFAVVVTEQASRRLIRCSRGRYGGTEPIDFAGGPGTVQTYSYVDVLRGRVAADDLRGKIVIVGSSAPSLQDVHPTAASRRDLMPGAEIHANGISTLLRDTPLRDAPGWLDVALIVLLAMALPLGSLRIRALRPLFLAAALAVAYTALVDVAFLNGLIVTLTYPLLALTLATLGVLATTYTVEAIDRMRIRDTFARFVPERVVDEILAQHGDALRLGGVERTATVVFTDLRGFTSFSEGRSPDRVIETLNRYLTEMSEAILDHGGTLVSYLGDGILAVFGAPLSQEDHADRALAAAFEMAGPRLDGFNTELARDDPEIPAFRMGVGINTGPLMWGNVGSLRRLEYTAIGDTVNTASRLEGMTKDSGHQIFIADATVGALVREPPAPLQDVGELEVRGRLNTVRLWAPAAADETAAAAPAAVARPAGVR